MTPIEKWFLLPLFIHVLLIAVVGSLTLRARISAVKGGKTSLKSIALNSAGWPENVRKLGNNLNNQYEVPTLWYALSALLMATHRVDIIHVVLSFLFVIARVGHSYVHTTRNYVPLRMRVFMASLIAVFAMWLWFAFQIYVVG